MLVGVCPSDVSWFWVSFVEYVFGDFLPGDGYEVEGEYDDELFWSDGC